MLAKVHSPPRPALAGRGCALVGLPEGGAVVEVEADLNPRALPQVTLVGLPDAAVKESTERVRAAIVIRRRSAALDATQLRLWRSQPWASREARCLVSIKNA